MWWAKVIGWILAGFAVLGLIVWIFKPSTPPAVVTPITVASPAPATDCVGYKCKPLETVRDREEALTRDLAKKEVENQIADKDIEAFRKREVAHARALANAEATEEKLDWLEEQLKEERARAAEREKITEHRTLGQRARAVRCTGNAPRAVREACEARH